MAKKVPNRRSSNKVRMIHAGMIIGYAAIVLLAVAIVSTLALRKTDQVLKNKVITMTSSLNVQMKLNVESYLSRMENIATLAFGEELAYKYDATDPDNDEYESINIEKTITSRLFSLCIMENFVDYGIVYRNNRTVGKISNGTGSLFGEKLYSELESMIKREDAQDGWFTGYNGDYRRIYYVKRVHENAILFISFYANELNDVFDNPETLSDMDIRLVNEEYKIIYSKNGEDLGTQLPEEIKQRIGYKNSASSLDDKYMVSVNGCRDWYVVCSIPTNIILKEKNEMTRYIYMTAVIATLLAALAGMYISHILSNSLKSMVYSLDDKASIDQLTGVFNKPTFEEFAGKTLENSLISEYRALVIIDVDDFKQVNDNHGHAAGDRILESIGKILKDVFTENDYVGRIGGDEFCVLVNTQLGDINKLRAYTEKSCKELEQAFHNNKYAQSLEIKLSASIGIAMFPSDGNGFADLYRAADEALYESKSRGKDCYSFYKVKEKGGSESNA